MGQAVDEIEQAVQVALRERLTQLGVGADLLRRQQPQAVITRHRADFIIGHLCWHDAAGGRVEGPEVEVSLSRPMGQGRLVAEFVRGLVDSWSGPSLGPAVAFTPPVPQAPALTLRPDPPVRAEARPVPAFLIGAPDPALDHLQRLLLVHPVICGGAESQFLSLCAAALAEAPVAAGLAAYCGHETLLQSLRNLWAEIFAGFHAVHPAARLHLDRGALQAQTLTDLHRLFDRAPIVCVLRQTTREGGADLALVQAFQRAHPDHPVLLIRAKDMQADPRAVLVRVLAFLLPPDLPRSLPADLEALLTPRPPEEPPAEASPQGHSGTGWGERLLGGRRRGKQDSALG